MRDLLLSLLVLLVPVVLLIGGYQVVAGRTAPVAIDPAAELAAAEQAGLEVARPAGLPDGWVPIAADFRQAGDAAAGGTLRVGYVTPEGGSVQLLQSSVPPEQLLPDELPAGLQPAGAWELAGQQWQQYAGGGERALARLEPERTVLVLGAASEQELRELAGSLPAG